MVVRIAYPSTPATASHEATLVQVTQEQIMLLADALGVSVQPIVERVEADTMWEAWDLVQSRSSDIAAMGYGGWWFFSSYILDAFGNGVWSVVAHGSNTHTRLSEPLRITPITVVSAGDPAQGNLTSYGPGCHVVSPWITDNCSSGASQSCAVPYVAAMYAVLHALGWSYWDARALIESTPTYPAWTEEEGFGVYEHPASLPDPSTLPIGGPVDVSITPMTGPTGRTDRVRVQAHAYLSRRHARTVVQYYDGSLYWRMYETTAPSLDVLLPVPADGTWEVQVVTEDAAGLQSRVETYHSATLTLEQTVIGTESMTVLRSPDERTITIATGF